jgi:hypothetical protein
MRLSLTKKMVAAEEEEAGFWAKPFTHICRFLCCD